MPKAKMDLATERNPNQGGTYQRRLDDAFKALSVVKTETLQPEIAFAFYIFACEKVAKVMIGMKHGKPGPSPKFSPREAREHAPRLNRVMEKFLMCRGRVETFLNS